MLGDWTRKFARAVLPPRAHGWLKEQRLRLRRCFPVASSRFGALRSVHPISRHFGADRGLGIERYYLEQFLAAYSAAIRGRVLEIAEDLYTRKFGGNRVAVSDVLHVIPGNPRATIVADLTRGDGLPDNAFDCLIVTQTLNFIYDVRAAIRTLHRILKPGGVLLASVSGISQISRYDMDRWGDYWRFSPLSIRRLLEEAFPPEGVFVQSYGNVLASIAFLHGLAAEDLRKGELDHQDPDFPLLIAVRAQRPPP